VYEDGPAIALPQAEHRLIPNLRGEYTGTAEDLFARDIGNLRDFTSAPEEAIEALNTLFRGLFD